MFLARPLDTPGFDFGQLRISSRSGADRSLRRRKTRRVASWKPGAGLALRAYGGESNTRPTGTKWWGKGRARRSPPRIPTAQHVLAGWSARAVYLLANHAPRLLFLANF